MLQTLQLDGISPVIRAPDSTFLKKDELGVSGWPHQALLLVASKEDLAPMYVPACLLPVLSQTLSTSFSGSPLS